MHDGVTLVEDFSEPNGKKKKKKKSHHHKEKTHKDKVDERDVPARVATVGEPSVVQLSEPSVVPENVGGTSTEAPLALVEESQHRGASTKKNKKKKNEQKEGSESPAREESCRP